MVGGGIDYSAAFQRAIELIGKRWTGAVVKGLLPGPARFNQLLAGIPGISDRVLTARRPGAAGASELSTDVPRSGSRARVGSSIGLGRGLAHNRDRRRGLTETRTHSAGPPSIFPVLRASGDKDGTY